MRRWLGILLSVEAFFELGLCVEQDQAAQSTCVSESGDVCEPDAELEEVAGAHVGLLQRSLLHKGLQRDTDAKVVQSSVEREGGGANHTAVAHANTSRDVSSQAPYVCSSDWGQCSCNGVVYFGRKFVSGRPGSGAEASFEQMKQTPYAQNTMMGTVQCNKCCGDYDPYVGFFKQCWCEPKALPPPPPHPEGMCEDTPGWTNGYNCRADGKREADGCAPGGWTCDGYRGQGWCANEGPARGMEFAFGSWARSPGKNCCGCGKGRASCNFYGCSPFDRSRACQCNPECKQYGSCCHDYDEMCAGGEVNFRMKGYHQTSKEICQKIMETNFRPGHGGWCSGAIYFAKTPEATVTKAIADSSNDGCMIEALIDVGKQRRAGKDCDHLNEHKIESMGYNSVIFNPGDGDEIVVYQPERVIAKTILPYQERWRVHSLRRRRRGN